MWERHGITVWDGVGISGVTPVPVVRNALIAGRPYELHDGQQVLGKCSPSKLALTLFSGPEIDMKLLRTSLFSTPSGLAAVWLAMKRYMKVKAACETAMPAKGPYTNFGFLSMLSWNR